MNKKGFTIIEILAVIVIMSILSTVAVVGVIKYKRVANERELIQLHSTIEECYNNYQKDMVLKGKSPNSNMAFVSSDEVFKEYFSELTYDGRGMNFDSNDKNNWTIQSFTISMHERGELIGTPCYEKLRGSSKYVQDRVCMFSPVKVNAENTDTELDSEEGETEGTDAGEVAQTNTCADPLKGSKEKVLCISLVVDNDKELFNDNALSKNLCYYFDSTNINNSECEKPLDFVEDSSNESDGTTSETK